MRKGFWFLLSYIIWRKNYPNLKQIWETPKPHQNCPIWKLLSFALLCCCRMSIEFRKSNSNFLLLRYNGSLLINFLSLSTNTSLWSKGIINSSLSKSLGSIERFYNKATIYYSYNVAIMISYNIAQHIIFRCHLNELCSYDIGWNYVTLMISWRSNGQSAF